MRAVLSKEERLAKLAKDNDCVATRAELRKAKFSVKEIRTALARKRWQPLQRGVYLLSAGNPTWRQEVRAALAAAGPGAQMTARTLAAWIGLDGATPSVIELVVPCGKGPAPRGVTIHRTRHPSKKRMYDGLAGTQVERLLVDYAAAVSLDLAERAVESALTMGLTAEHRIWRELATLGEAVPGVRVLTRIMEERPNGKAARSTLELDLLRLIRKCDLPLPERNFDVYVDGEHFEIDLAYVPVLGAIEADSRKWHSTATQKAKDKRRQDRLELAGWTFVRITSADVYGRPEWVVEQIRGLLCGVVAA
jgi:hypothetical protein